MTETGFLFRNRLYVIVGSVAVAVLIAASWIAWRAASSGGEQSPEASAGHAHAHAESGDAGETQLYMCPMNCIKPRPEPGRCPICGMELVPVPKGVTHGDSEAPRLMMSDAAMKLAEVQTTLVERRFVDIELRLTGKVDFDETRVRTIAARVPGRIERLYVDYTGVQVKKGDKLARMYSPDLVEAQSSLIIASTGISRGDAETYPTRSSPRLVEGLRHRLRQLGLLDSQIAEIERTGNAIDTIDIHSPMNGTVVEKSVMEGAYVMVGTKLYVVADLERVWVWLDAYESEIAWLRYGQEVQIKTEAYGDEVFHGWVSFVEPVLNPMTRTVRVRVIADNSDGLLRPNMFVRTVVRVRVGKGGKIVAGKNLSGKWISPRHPEIVRDEPGKCPICGIDLARAEALGYASTDEAETPLIIPASAVLLTGRRGIVYVRVPGEDKPTFEGVEVELGPRAGDYYIVHSGLEEGREVVTNGNFKIDSALQLIGKRSMMNPHRAKPMGSAHEHH